MTMNYSYQAEIYQKMLKMKNGSCIIIGTPPRSGKSVWREQMRSMQSVSRMYRVRSKSKNTLTLKQYIRRVLK